MDISKVAIDTIKSLNDNQERPVHAGEAMSCWIYQTQLDGVLGYCEIAINLTKDPDILNTINKSHDLSLRHKEMLNNFMKKEQITPSDGYVQRPEVDTATIPDALKQTEKDIINTIQINATVAFGLTATALSQCLRKDLQIIFFKIMTDVMIFNQEMSTLSEKRGWLRIPPAYHPSV
jgi:hypothetical protein